MRTLVTSYAVRMVALSLLCSGSELHAQQVLYTVYGDLENDFFGAACNGAGDVDADGRADFVVGARYASVGGVTSGMAWIYSGQTGLPLYTPHGDVASDSFGADVSGAGDVNGDGHADVVIGVPRHDGTYPDIGAARVISGQDGSILFTAEGTYSRGELGSAVSGAGDVNGDGFTDIIAGASRSDVFGYASGTAHVFSGLDGSELRVFYGDAREDYLGQCVSGAGDANGDGYDDMIVGVPGDDSNGVWTGGMRVYSGADGSLLFGIVGDREYDQLGNNVSGAGDVNNDGLGDVIVSIPGYDGNATNSGAARIYSGAGISLGMLQNPHAGFNFPYEVSGAGDVDNDGYDDLLAGMPTDSTNGTRAGAMFVFSGSDRSLLYSMYGDAQYVDFGHSVAGAGDVDGDGFPDVIGSSIYDAADGSSSGLARVYSGENGAIRSAGAGCAGSGGFAPSLTLLGTARLYTPVTLLIQNGPGGAQSALAISTGPGSLDLGNGCTIAIAWPAAVLVPLGALSGTGAGAGSLAVGATFHPVGTIYGQGLVLDPSYGLTVTNAIELQIVP